MGFADGVAAHDGARPAGGMAGGSRAAPGSWEGEGPSTERYCSDMWPVPPLRCLVHNEESFSRYRSARRTADRGRIPPWPVRGARRAQDR